MLHVIIERKLILITLINVAITARVLDSAPHSAKALEAAGVCEENSLKDNASISHQRKRRYLAFDKGATVVFQGNIGKAIIAGMPRGLNEITEYTLSYELPTGNEMFKSKSKDSEQIADITTTTAKITTSQFWKSWQEWQQHAPPTATVARNWHNKQYLWCPRENFYENFVKGKANTRWCERQAIGGRQRRSSSNTLKPETRRRTGGVAERVFLDLVGMWAQLHGYNARHCIMRTLCESQHMLLPKGYILFHDLVRILINFARPAVERHAPYKRALLRENLNDCTKLYGPHCRLSLLQQFTAKTALAAATKIVDDRANAAHERFM